MTSVIEALTQAPHRYRRIFYRTEFGNAGDALINAGFYAVADRLQLPYTPITGGRRHVPEARSDDLIILAGGGAMTSHWEDGPRTVEAMVDSPASLLLLPQTLHGHDDLLRRLRPRDTLFVRERYSLEHARTVGLSCALHLDHDVAFALDTAAIQALPPRRLPRGLDENRRALALGRLRLMAARGLPLRVWRQDAEAADPTRRARRRDDLSLLCNYGTSDSELNMRSARSLLGVISWFDRVETDRLHVAVGAALLGKQVRMHACAYHKIRGVYEYSIATNPRLRSLVAFVPTACQRASAAPHQPS